MTPEIVEGVPCYPPRCSVARSDVGGGLSGVLAAERVGVDATGAGQAFGEELERQDRTEEGARHR